MSTNLRVNKFTGRRIFEASHYLLVVTALGRLVVQLKVLCAFIVFPTGEYGDFKQKLLHHGDQIWQIFAYFFS
jgi:hypothetical protein